MNEHVLADVAEVIENENAKQPNMNDADFETEWDADAEVTVDS